MSLEWLELTKGHGGPEWLLGLEWPSRLKREHRTPEKLSLEWPSRLRKGLHRPPIKALKASKLLRPLLGLVVELLDRVPDVNVLPSPLQHPIPLPVEGATLHPLPQSVGVDVFVFPRLVGGPEITHRAPLGDLVRRPGLPLKAGRLRLRGSSVVGGGGWSRGGRGREGLRGGVGVGGAGSRGNHVGYGGVFKIWGGRSENGGGGW